MISVHSRRDRRSSLRDHEHGHDRDGSRIPLHRVRVRSRSARRDVRVRSRSSRRDVHGRSRILRLDGGRIRSLPRACGRIRSLVPRHVHDHGDDARSFLPALPADRW